MSQLALMHLQNGMHSKLEEEIAKHQTTRTKLQNAEKEIRELKKLYEKLANKHKKISYLFNELKTVVDEDPPVSIPKFLRMTHTSGEEHLPDPNLTPTESPAISHKVTSEPTAGNPPLASEPSATQPIPVSPTITAVVVTPSTSTPGAPSPVPSPPTPATTPPVEGETAPASPSSIPSSAHSPTPTPVLTPSLSSGSLSNSTSSLPSADGKSASPRPGRNYLTRLFSSGSSGKSKEEKEEKAPKLKSQDSWIYDRRDHIIAQFLRAEKSYCSNLNVIVEVRSNLSPSLLSFPLLA
jgi:hypothetical protein